MPGTNVGRSRPLASSSGLPLAPTAKFDRKTYPVDDCEFPPTRVDVKCSAPLFTSWLPSDRAGLYYLVNPPVGTATVAVTMSTSANVAASATTFTGVDPVAPFTPVVSAGATSATASVSLPSQAGELVLSTMAATGDAKTLTLIGTGTSRWNVGTGTGSANVRGAMATRSGGSTVTVGWTLGASKPFGLLATALRPVVVTVATPTTTRTGAGVTVAVIDSGLLQDGGGTSRIKTTRDFTTGNATPAHVAPGDGYGHGTHVGGLIGGDQAEVKGVAPGVSYVSLRVLDDYGVGSTSSVIKAIEWAVANKAAYGIDILNLSLGHPIFEPAATDPLVQAVEAAVRNHLVVVTSAGNYGTNPLTGQVGYAGVSSPGNAPSAITVGAEKTFDTNTRTDDVMADYSSRGPSWYDGFVKPDVVAPGHNLVSAAATAQTLYTRLPTKQVTLGGRPYLKLSGTSMATGVVSGTVALMLEQAKATYGVVPPVNAIKAMLQASAFPMNDAAGATYHVLAQGAGALNAAGALELATAINPTTPVGSAWLATGVSEATTIDGQNIVWGDNVVWGDNIVWGDSNFTHNIVFGQNIVWGDSLFSGGNVASGGSSLTAGGGSESDSSPSSGGTFSGEALIYSGDLFLALQP